MCCEKVRTDFEKRFGEKAEFVYFLGKGITFFEDRKRCVGCNVSAGEYVAVSRRTDDRLMIQFSHTDKFLTVNTQKLKESDDEEIFGIFQKMQSHGIEIGGARIFFYKNSPMGVGSDELIFMSAGAFCKNIPSKERLLYAIGKTIPIGVGKENYLHLTDVDGIRYFPFRKSSFKIVLCSIEDKGVKSRAVDSSETEGAIEALKREDYEAFGRLLNRESEKIIKTNRLKATGRLFEVACRQREAVGNGVIDEGGIFSLVENKNVNAYIRNLSMEYRRFYGAAPDFYVTDTETCGRIL